MRMIESTYLRKFIERAALACAATLFAIAQAQADAVPGTPTVEPAPAVEAAPTGPLAQFAWLAGCWRGEVKGYQFREQWMPLRGELLVGVSHTVKDGKTLGYEYLRLENRPDGVYYVAVPEGKSETALKFDSASADGNATNFRFTNASLPFPRELIYRRASAGWLYASLKGKVGDADREVYYPMQRISCETGELITQ